MRPVPPPLPPAQPPDTDKGKPEPGTEPDTWQDTVRRTAPEPTSSDTPPDNQPKQPFPPPETEASESTLYIALLCLLEEGVSFYMIMIPCIVLELTVSASLWNVSFIAETRKGTVEWKGRGCCRRALWIEGNVDHEDLHLPPSAFSHLRAFAIKNCPELWMLSSAKCACPSSAILSILMI